jgi:hypothetical protein
MNYTVKEVAEILGVKERAVQTKCKKDNVSKKGNKYLITSEIIHAWKLANANANANAKELENSKTKGVIEQTNESNANANAKEQIEKVLHNPQLDLEIESLKAEIEVLKEELISYKIEPNERIEVFTFEEYNLFEQRLREWNTQRIEIEHQEQLFNAEKKSLSELYQHYKNQFEYQRNQNSKVLEMHQKLIDLIGDQNKLAIQRNIIEAGEKDIINKDNWKPK